MAGIDFRLYLITDRQLCKAESLPEVIQKVCQQGVKAIQLREKDLPPVELYKLAKEIKSVCQKTQSMLFINDRADIAQTLDLAGVQLTSQSLPAAAVRKCFSHKRLIGVSTHSLQEAQKAEHEGCDFLLFGPIFQTPSKFKYGSPHGLPALAELTKNVRAPVFAVGGIDPQKASMCLDHGASGVAVISSILQAPNMRKAIDDFRQHMGRI